MHVAEEGIFEVVGAGKMNSSAFHRNLNVNVIALPACVRDE